MSGLTPVPPLPQFPPLQCVRDPESLAIPQILLDFFNRMVDPMHSQAVDTDAARLCAFRFGREEGRGVFGVKVRF